jgi:L-lactate dehydrogenase
LGNIFTADLEDARDADIIIVTAGVNQRPKETRMELVARNLEVLRSIKQGIGTIKKEAIVILISNPVDILTWAAHKEWGLEWGRVFGTGTILDSARLCRALSEKTGVHPNSVQGWVLGEHGQTEFVAWSTVKTGGLCCEAIGLDSHKKNELEEQVRQKAFAIIERKGSTFFGIGACTAEIVSSIIGDTHRVLPLSVPIMSNEYGLKQVSLGVPALVGINGVEKIIEIDLEPQEQEKLKSSAQALKQIWQEQQT